MNATVVSVNDLWQKAKRTIWGVYDEHANEICGLSLHKALRWIKRPPKGNLHDGEIAHLETICYWMGVFEKDGNKVLDKYALEVVYDDSGDIIEVEDGNYRLVAAIKPWGLRKFLLLNVNCTKGDNHTVESVVHA